ncbi:MAG: peptidylprolyl isomerase [Muribaculaceae bacterium]|nr:peptidylprolyl isomerase [Muribaculaceae bacterium]
MQRVIVLLLIILTIPQIINSKSNTQTKKINKKELNVMAAENLTKIIIKTNLGDIELALYDDTPIHRDNILKLINEGYYNGTIFHRVIKSFMIQGGDGDSKGAPKGKMLGAGDPGYTLPAEFVYPKYFHKKGALAAARTDNPEKKSSGSQFYIVTGRVFSKGELDNMIKQKEYRAKQDLFQQIASPYRKEIMKMQIAKDSEGIEAMRQKLIAQTEAEYSKNPIQYTEEQIQAYTTIGGAPHLDGEYTVYGEVTKGLDIVEKIENVETEKSDRPKEDVIIIDVIIKK